MDNELHGSVEYMNIMRSFVKVLGQEVNRKQMTNEQYKRIIEEVIIEFAGTVPENGTDLHVRIGIEYLCDQIGKEYEEREELIKKLFV